jgi:hypothetical protein
MKVRLPEWLEHPWKPSRPYHDLKRFTIICDDVERALSVVMTRD